MKSVRLTADRNIDLQEILKGEPFSCFCSEDGMYLREFIEGDGKITVCIGEEFYFRTNSTLMVAMIVKEEPNKTIVDIVSGGGKTGWLNVSWGSENSAVKKIKWTALRRLPKNTRKINRSSAQKIWKHL